MSDKIKSVLMRFIKGFIAGALAAIGLLTLQAPTSWEELSKTLLMLAFAAVSGGITGGLLAVEKYLGWVDSATQ